MVSGPIKSLSLFLRFEIVIKLRKLVISIISVNIRNTTKPLQDIKIQL